MATVTEVLAIAFEHHRAGRQDVAEALYWRIIEADPSNYDARHLLGLVVRRTGNYTLAADLIRSAVALRPESKDAFYNLGNTLRMSGRLDEAEAAYRAALILRPDEESALINLGNTLIEQGRPSQAVETFERLTRKNPRHVDAWNNMGAALKTLNRFDEALAAFNRALELDPDSSGTYNNLAMTLMAQGRMHDAIGFFRKALHVAPDYAAAHSNLLLCLNYEEQISNAALLAEHAAWDLRHGRNAGPPYFSDEAAVDRDPDRPLRVGYISADFGRHPVGYFLGSVMPRHDPAQVRFYAYSARLGEDDLTRSLRQASTGWRSILGVDDSRLAQWIQEDRIDILVDLSGHTAGHRLSLFARRAAPIQVAWIGYFNTTGLSAMDYVLMDPHTVPAGEERWFVEEVVRLPDGRFCYQPPEYAPPVAPPPCLARGHVTFGSFNNLSKVTPEVIRLWADVLHAVPDSRMVIKWQTLNAASERERLQAAFIAEQIAPERLDLRGPSWHQDMLKEYDDIDIALDTFPFCGGLTSCEALWMGLPVVTWPGSRPVSRQTLGFLAALGREEWTAVDAPHYVSIAARLAADPQTLAVLRQEQRARMLVSPLCDGTRFAAHLEQAFRAMWRRWLRLHKPAPPRGETAAAGAVPVHAPEPVADAPEPAAHTPKEETPA